MIKMETITIVATKPWLTYDAPRWLRCVEFFVRVRICRQRPYLIDKWTVTDSEDCETQYGLDVTEEITRVLVQNTDAKFIESLNERTWAKYDD